MKFNGPNLTTKDERKAISWIIDGYKKQGKYLGELLDEEALMKGYAIHNAGMLPEQKELVETLFQKKLVKVAFATETLSAGINMPARTTVISSLVKPVSREVNENGKRFLEPNEFHQMAGRAGRRGIDQIGYVYCMAVNKAQSKAFQKLINQKANDIESHLKTDFAFVANINKNFDSKDFTKNFYKKTLYAYDPDPKVKEQKVRTLVNEFNTKEKILKANDFIDKNNKLTEKGELLTQINGYEQIPIIDAVFNEDMKGLNPIQIAGYAAGLATLTKEEPKGRGDSFVPFEDSKLEEKANDLSEQVFEYNKDVYAPMEKQLYLNTDAMKHVYTWAEKNAFDDDSTENWHDMFKGDTGFRIKDEGTLFREITMTTDLLKQINNIAEYGKELTANPAKLRYYNKLQEGCVEAIDLINRKPAKQDE